ncbi:flagellin [Halarcobacter sp.]|uniref:flagellin n=1 Tax=Halarcobacter sp. TaxID=2321133 RepID=UPI002AA755FB|nr:flagellin [Halarcobacter sp.]|eukprot:Anaeramoba_ignava/a90653_22.p1 GENE.a90653_22~~a90653_22.p1  ORF type:complete len:108 (-),score=29.57 a90653_22:47-370(-)
MELGKVAEIDNAKVNHIEKVKSVQEVDDKEKIVDNEQHKKIIGSTQENEINEVILDNVKFGYNKNSKDLFVKVTRGDTEYKYPTEDMMRVKAQLLSEMEKAQREQNN